MKEVARETLDAGKDNGQGASTMSTDPDDEFGDECNMDSGSESDPDPDPSFANLRASQAQTHKQNPPSGGTDGGRAGKSVSPVRPLTEHKPVCLGNIKDSETMSKFLDICSAVNDLKASMGLVGTLAKHSVGKRKKMQGEWRKPPGIPGQKVYYYSKPDEPISPREKGAGGPMDEYVEALDQGDHTHVELKKYLCYKCFNCMQENNGRCVHC